LALHGDQDDDVADEELLEGKKEQAAPIVVVAVGLLSVEAARQQAYGGIAP
jgi:hypothetical protein